MANTPQSQSSAQPQPFQALSFQCARTPRRSPRSTSRGFGAPLQATVPTVTPVVATADTGFHASRYQQDIFDWVRNGTGHAIVNAVAGAGKTTTMVQAARLIPEEALFVAFNKVIAEALQAKLAGTRMKARTIHSVGFGCLIKAMGKLDVQDNKYRKLAREYSESEAGDLTFDQRRSLNDVLYKLADKARLTLTDPRNEQAILDMMAHYGIEVAEEVVLESALALLPPLLSAGQRQAEQAHIVDFTDQVYLPVKLGLPKPKFAWLMVDECQDLNRCQRTLVLDFLADDGRALFVGDPNQSIMGFAGADNNSFWAIQQATIAREMPLSICYRCPSSHLDLAREIVPQIEARPDAPVGVIEHITDSQFAQTVQPGDMVLCRLTAPLVAKCIELIGRKVPAHLRGRDLSRSLTVIVEAVMKREDATWADFGTHLDEYQREQVLRLAQKDGNEAKVQSLLDRCEGVRVCWEEFNCSTPEALCGEIESLFSDSRAGVTLSTVHRAKGLEERRVFILKPHKLPLEWPKQQPWEAQQERNLRYVALTRATEYLCFVHD